MLVMFTDFTDYLQNYICLIYCTYSYPCTNTMISYSMPLALPLEDYWIASIHDACTCIPSVTPPPPPPGYVIHVL